MAIDEVFSMKFKLTLVCVAIVLSTPNGNAQGNVYALGILNSSISMETAAAQFAVGVLNNRLKADNSSFTIRLQNIQIPEDLDDYASFLNSDVIAILDLMPTTVRPASLMSIVAMIPVFRFHGTHGFKMNNMSIIMSADYDSYAHATINILQTFHWTEIAVLFDLTHYNEAVYFQVSAINKGFTLTYIKFVEEPNSSLTSHCACEKAMKELAASGVDVILLYANERSTRIVMNGCDPRKSYVWIIQGSVSKQLNSYGNQMVIGFGYQTNQTFQNVTWNVTMSEENILLVYEMVLVAAMALKSAHENGSWLLGNDSVTLATNRKTFYRHAQMVNTSSIRFDSNGRRVVEKLRILNLQNDTFTEVGKWTKTASIVQLTSGLHLNKQTLDATMLRGRKMSVVMIQSVPFQMKTILADGTVSYHGFCIEILKRLALDLKFTYEIHEGADGFYGTRINGEWNGMIRELLDGKADMIIGDITRTSERENYIATTAGFMHYTDKLIMKKVIVKDVDFLQFMSPFSREVWMILLLFVIMITFAVYTLNYVSPYGHKNDKGTKTSEEFNLFNSLWFSLACMLQQGPDNTPRNTSGRVLVAFFWFSILVWVSTYTANLVAFFTVKTLNQPVNNLEEALLSNYKIGVTYQSNLHRLFKATDNELYKKVLKRIEKFPMNYSQALEWIRTGQRYMHINNGPRADYETQKKPCDLITVPGLETPRSYGFALKQDDPHVDEISRALLWLRETGYIQKLKKKYWDFSNECPDTKSKQITNKSIELESMSGVFIVLAAGCVISLIILAVEIYWDRVRKRRDKKRNGSAKNQSKCINVIDNPAVFEESSL